MTPTGPVPPSVHPSTAVATPTIAPDVAARIAAFLEHHGLTARTARLDLLTGDASDRRYVRVHAADGSSIVLAVHTGPIEAATMPFMAVWRFMREVPLPVPDILHHSDALGILAQEDLGDVTLQAALTSASADERRAYYQQAVEMIIGLQAHGEAVTDRREPPFTLAFDVEKLTWELDFFSRHFLGAFRGLSLSPAQQAALADEWAPIVRELADEPRVVCHRDYHSRNLMAAGSRLVVIDFQDARMGPDTYDLVSLLRDSYVELPIEEREQLIAVFAAGRYGGDAEARLPELRRRVTVMALQRNLKALGTFGYQASTRHNPVYAQYVPRTLGYVRETLIGEPRFARLGTLLAELVVELR